MSFLAVVLGIALVGAALADMVNTLVSTTTNQRGWWLTRVLYLNGWRVVRALAVRIRSESRREALLSIFAPVSLLVVLTIWVVQQIVGFGLIWWGIGGVDGATSLADSVYFSGVIYFTLGFGEIVPVGAWPRFGALAEAMAGVLTTALVIGYLPALYSAYSERERKLMTLDDGTEERITPTNLLLSRAPTASTDEVLRFFEGWEEWVTAVLETHTTLPMLRLFRSQHAGQNWITALGLLSDAALQCQIIKQTRNQAPYWLLRRSIVLFDALVGAEDLSEYRTRLDESYQLDSGEISELFVDLYRQLEDHGFDLIPIEQAREETMELRRRFDAQMEFLIDFLVAPRGFWGHQVGHTITASQDR